MSTLFDLPYHTPLETFFTKHIQGELDGIAVPDDHAPRGMTIDIRGPNGGIWSIESRGGALHTVSGESETAVLRIISEEEEFREFSFGVIRNAILSHPSGERALQAMLSSAPGAISRMREGQIQSLLNQVKGTIQLNIEAEDEDLTCAFRLQFGPNEETPQTTVSIELRDYAAMLTGEMQAQQAFMAGKIRLAGDMTLPMTLMSMVSGN